MKTRASCQEAAVAQIEKKPPNSEQFSFGATRPRNPTSYVGMWYVGSVPLYTGYRVPVYDYVYELRTPIPKVHASSSRDSPYVAPSVARIGINGTPLAHLLKPYGISSCLR